VAWGYNYHGACDVPSPNTGFIDITGGADHSLGLKSDGSIVSWGDDYYGQCSVPSPNCGFTALAAGGHQSIGLRGSDTPVDGFFYAIAIPPQGVVLRWLLPSYPDCAGLRLYRAPSITGTYTCITPSSLPCDGQGNYVDGTAWPGGTFWYELRAVLLTGDEAVATEIHPRVTVPGEQVLGIRYVMPNPTAAHVTIGYALPDVWESARLSVHDSAGRLIRRLGPAIGTRGLLAVDWDGRTGTGKRVASGVYFIRLEVDGIVWTDTSVLLR
jgi:hypothetical protein